MSLRDALANLSDEDQRLLVQIAFQAMNDIEVAAEVADLVGIDKETLAGPQGYTEMVLVPLFELASD